MRIRNWRGNGHQMRGIQARRDRSFTNAVIKTTNQQHKVTREKRISFHWDLKRGMWWTTWAMQYYQRCILLLDPCFSRCTQHRKIPRLMKDEVRHETFSWHNKWMKAAGVRIWSTDYDARIWKERWIKRTINTWDVAMGIAKYRQKALHALLI